jgi:hypothetical protein
MRSKTHQKSNLMSQCYPFNHLNLASTTHIEVIYSTNSEVQERANDHLCPQDQIVS